jgi:hypothetical protein
MQIQIDTREHKRELARIEEQLRALGVDYFKSKLYVGDYMSLDNPRLVVDRKKDLLELCGNVCQQHERFRAELIRAKEHGIKLIILVEHGPDIKSLEDVYFWQNPRNKPSRWVMSDGRPIKVPEKGGGIQGEQLFRSLCTIRDRYDVTFAFCEKGNTGAEIVRLLGGIQNGGNI